MLNNTTGNIIMEDPTENICDFAHREYTHTTTEQIKSQTTTTIYRMEVPVCLGCGYFGLHLSLEYPQPCL